MSHYEKSLQADLERIRAGVLDVAESVESNLEAALRALLSTDSDLAYATILRDHPINRAVEEVDSSCHRFVVRHLPSAGHLRFISAVLRMNIELERIGDYAETICQEVTTLTGPLEGQFRREVERMGKDALDMYRSAIESFTSQNAEKARATKSAAKSIERDFHVAYEQLASEGEEGVGTTRDRFSKLVVLSMLERVSDQAKNLCEEVVWALTGERKKRRPMKVLFIDRANTVFAPLAVAAGRKSHPKSGVYDMAAANPAAQISEEVSRFLSTSGHEVSELVPSRIDWPVESWGNFDIIVSFEGSYADYVDNVPFNTVALNWAVGNATDSVDDLYRNILSHVVELMDMVRGREVEYES